MTIRTNQPGALSGNRTIEINDVFCGFDWESRQLILVPVKEITETGSTVGFNKFYNLLTQHRLFSLKSSHRYMVRYLEKHVNKITWEELSKTKNAIEDNKINSPEYIELWNQLGEIINKNNLQKEKNRL